MTTTVTTPDFTGFVDQSFFLAPLGGPQNPVSYLDRFPESIYNKTIDSHLVRFVYAMLGPAGVGWLRKNYLDARLKLEEYGLDTFDLDQFYGNPLGFGRIIEEMYDVSPTGLVDRLEWEQIRSKDASYRNRAIDYVQGAKAGNTPLGMHLVARSGLGHECEVVEQYKYLYDQLADDPLGLPNLGFTSSLSEMVIIPRRELPQSEIQVLYVNGDPTGGTFTLFFPVGNQATNQTAPLAYNSTRAVVQAALENIGTIGSGNVRVTGGPLPVTPLEILFTGKLANRDVPQLQVNYSLTGGTLPTMIVTTKRSGIDQVDEVVYIAPRDQHYLTEAINRIKPVTTIVTFGKGQGTRSTQTFNTVTATSTYNEVVRYVTGQQGIQWPERSNVRWIEKGVEHRAPRAFDDLTHHYSGFHNLANVVAYTDAALDDPDYENDAAVLARYPNEHIGPFTQYQNSLFPVLGDTPSAAYTYLANDAPADYAEPLTVSSNTASTDNPVALVNGIYPTEYSNLPGVPPIKYKEDQFYSSVERTEGDDYLEIDFGRVEAINYIYFETISKPFDIELAFDLLDLSPRRRWLAVTPVPDMTFPASLGYNPVSQNPWTRLEFYFTNNRGNMIYTRYMRLKFSRRLDADSPFLSNSLARLPYSVEVRNLRVGRNVS
jgi:hypothetical protein